MNQLDYKARFSILISTLFFQTVTFGQGVPQGRFVDPRPVPGIDFDAISRVEALPTVSADGLEIMFLSFQHGKTEIFHATRDSVSMPFETPVPLHSVNSLSHDDTGDLSADGLTFYFSSDRDSTRHNIYRATRSAVGQPFQDIQKLGPHVNTEAGEGGATVTADGKTLFFVRVEELGIPGELWMATDEGTGFNNAVTLANANDGYENAFPSASSDGRFVFFSDFDGAPGVRPGGLGGEDLWVTYRESADDEFGEPINVNDLWPGSEVNSDEREAGVRISRDWPQAGSTIYWTTDYRANPDMLYATWVPTLEGDLDSDGQLDTDDIELLARRIREESEITAFDLNADGTVNLDDQTMWIHDLKNTWIGDANLDGEFNSTDFVHVFQAGKYETGLTANWSEGDWNADGRFDSGDFVAAFIDDGFETGPRPATQAVPEPTGYVLTLSAIALIGLRRRFITSEMR